MRSLKALCKRLHALKRVSSGYWMVSDMTRCVHCLPLLGTLMLVASSLVLTPVWVAAQEVSEPSAEVNEPSAEDLAAELKLLQDVQAGMALALAACGDEPHCVT